MADVQLKTPAVLDLLGITTRKTLYKWAKRCGIDTSKGYYWQSEVNQIMEAMTGSSSSEPSTPEEEGQYAHTEAQEMGSEALSGFLNPYSPMIDQVGTSVAHAVVNEIHIKVAKELYAIVMAGTYQPPLVQAMTKAIAPVRGSQLFLSEAVAR